jgi:hypothetical protein
MGFVASVCQPSTFRMLIYPEASSAQNNMAAVSADGSTVWVLIRRLNSSCRRSIAFVVLALRHWLTVTEASFSVEGRPEIVFADDFASMAEQARAIALERHRPVRDGSQNLACNWRAREERQTIPHQGALV